MKIQIFKDITLKWWQVGIFKITIIAFGIAVGAYWAEFFVGSLKILVAIFILGWLYLAFVWMRNWEDEPVSTNEINNF